MTFTDIDICSQALVMIGAEPISSFSDGTTESIVATTLYEATVQDTLGNYPWRFATAQAVLTRLAAEPETEWDAAYQLPSNILSIETVMINDNAIDFDRFEDRIFCNATETDEVILEATYRVDEQFWPPYYINYLRLRLASLFAHSVAAQTDTASMIDRKAMREGAIARNQDARSRTAPRFLTDRFIRNRGVR